MDPLSMFECSVCCEPFDGDEHRPKLVSCGHTFCKSCLQRIAVSEGSIAKCPEDRDEINIRSPTHLKDNKFIMSWVEELKSRHQVETRLLTCPEPVSVSSSSWRAEGLQLSEEPALRLAMLLLMHRGKLQELGGEQQQQQQEARPVDPPRLQVVDVFSCCRSAPGKETPEKNLLLKLRSPIHVLSGVSWERDPDFVKALLLRHASTLQELQVTSLCSIGASALSRLPKLRKLSLCHFRDCRVVPERWLGRLQSLEVRSGPRAAVPGLLRAHRDSLQEVHLFMLGRAEVLELQRMPALRSLLFSKATIDCVLPGLWQGRLQQLYVKSFYGGIADEAVVISVLSAHRESLQDVHLDVASREQLLKVQQMPALQKLSLGSATQDLLRNPALPEVWLCRLQELRVSGMTPLQTARSVLCAHRGSLRHLGMDMEPWGDTDESLPAFLRQCGLQRLRTLKMTRIACSHPPACKAQLAAWRDRLPGCTVTCCGPS